MVTLGNHHNNSGNAPPSSKLWLPSICIVFNDKVIWEIWENKYVNLVHGFKMLAQNSNVWSITVILSFHNHHVISSNKIAMVGIVFNHSSCFSFSNGPSMNQKDTVRHHRSICNQFESYIAAWNFDLVGERRNHPTSRFQFQRENSINTICSFRMWKKCGNLEQRSW